MTEFSSGEHLPIQAALGEYDYSPDTFKSAIVRIKTLPYIPAGITEDVWEKGYKQKPEYHVTLLPDDLFKLLDRLMADELAQNLQLVCARFDQIELSNDLFQISKPKIVNKEGTNSEYERNSIIAPLQQDSEFVHEIYKVYAHFGIPEANYPFLHVTLFTWPDNEYADKGIGIASTEDLHAMRPQLYGHLYQESL